MISEEKLMMLILRDYYICKLYSEAYISTRNISLLTGVSTPAVKRALHLVDDRKANCLRLLPKAFKEAEKENIISKIDYIDEEVLDLLQSEVDMASLELKAQGKWLTSSLETGNALARIISTINDKYCVNKRNIKMTKKEVKRLKENGKSFQETATALGIAKSTAYNYYVSGEDDYQTEIELGEISAKNR